MSDPFYDDWCEDPSHAAWASGIYPEDVREALSLFAERYRWKP